ncbi:hypothetical protein G166_gp24 [Clostridium phage phi8074-B1]|uniref:hypothetical protein n=1 Tax=Clostridium phage phi8074-B1 TaxID=1147137 RepID=UPI00025C0C4B|nr:hypothetical protein G166_gp24 [Clostridium phage phi8074-B1]AFC61956.1 hypothetical protein phi8074-B1_00024 [Clostridium phage phi8074-B1]
MFKDLISLLEARGFYIDVPVNMGELYKCVLDNLPIQDLLSVCENDFAKCVSKCHSNYLSVCHVVMDMGGETEKVLNALDSFESKLKTHILNYIVSPDHILVHYNKIFLDYLEYESLIV